MISTRSWIARRVSVTAQILIWLCTGWGLIGTAQAKDAFPNYPVTVYIPYPAGGSLDMVGRPLAEYFQKTSGQAMVIQHLGGAGGTICAARVAHAKPDGYTLILASNGQVSLADMMYKNLPYKPSDLVPVIYMVDQPAVLYASAKSPYRSLADLTAAIKAGKSIEIASSGTGSISDLSAYLLEKNLQTHFVHVPYRGAAPAVQDLAGGREPLLFTFAGSATPLVQAGLIRPIAVASAQRLPEMPAVPTFAELGYPNVISSSWIGLMAPKGTPKAVINALYRDIKPLMNDSQFKKEMAENTMEIHGADPTQFMALVSQDAARWQSIRDVLPPAQ